MSHMHALELSSLLFCVGMYTCQLLIEYQAKIIYAQNPYRGKLLLHNRCQSRLNGSMAVCNIVCHELSCIWWVLLEPAWPVKPADLLVTHIASCIFSIEWPRFGYTTKWLHSKLTPTPEAHTSLVEQQLQGIPKAKGSTTLLIVLVGSVIVVMLMLWTFYSRANLVGTYCAKWVFACNILVVK